MHVSDCLFVCVIAPIPRAQHVLRFVGSPPTAGEQLEGLPVCVAVVLYDILGNCPTDFL